ncbi:hypothetical protein T261_0272 [Streptomyces lydicus]|nr:hypothetical protein T261_0272 [Streptomyces lydicus]
MFRTLFAGILLVGDKRGRFAELAQKSSHFTSSPAFSPGTQRPATQSRRTVSCRMLLRIPRTATALPSPP